MGSLFGLASILMFSRIASIITGNDKAGELEVRSE